MVEIEFRLAGGDLFLLAGLGEAVDAAVIGRKVACEVGKLERDGVYTIFLMDDDDFNGFVDGG